MKKAKSLFCFFLPLQEPLLNVWAPRSCLKQPSLKSSYHISDSFIFLCAYSLSKLGENTARNPLCFQLQIREQKVELATAVIAALDFSWPLSSIIHETALLHFEIWLLTVTEALVPRRWSDIPKAEHGKLSSRRRHSSHAQISQLFIMPPQWPLVAATLRDVRDLKWSSVAPRSVSWQGESMYVLRVGLTSCRQEKCYGCILHPIQVHGIKGSHRRKSIL